MEFITDTKPKQFCLNYFENIIKSWVYSTPIHGEFYTIPGFFPVIPHLSGGFSCQSRFLSWLVGFWVGWVLLFLCGFFFFFFLATLAYHRLQKLFYYKCCHILIAEVKLKLFAVLEPAQVVKSSGRKFFYAQGLVLLTVRFKPGYNEIWEEMERSILKSLTLYVRGTCRSLGEAITLSSFISIWWLHVILQNQMWGSRSVAGFNLSS